MSILFNKKIVFFFIFSFVSFTSGGQEKDNVRFQYKKFEKFDFEDLVIEGETSSPSDLSIQPKYKAENEQIQTSQTKDTVSLNNNDISDMNDDNALDIIDVVMIINEILNIYTMSMKYPNGSSLLLNNNIII